MGATHVLTKTLGRVSTEMSLHVLAYNGPDLHAAVAEFVALGADADQGGGFREQRQRDGCGRPGAVLRRLSIDSREVYHVRPIRRGARIISAVTAGEPGSACARARRPRPISLDIHDGRPAQQGRRRAAHGLRHVLGCRLDATANLLAIPAAGSRTPGSPSSCRSDRSDRQSG
jgi:hypothetical protein